MDPLPSPLAGGARRRWLTAGVVASLALLSAGSLAGYAVAVLREREQLRLITESRDTRATLTAMFQAQAAMRGFVLTQQPANAVRYQQALVALHQAAGTLRSGPLAQVNERLAAIQSWWDRIMADAANSAQLSAVSRLGDVPQKNRTEALQRLLADRTDALLAQWSRRSAALQALQNLLLIINGIGGIWTILALVYALRCSRIEARRREHAVAEALRAQREAVVGREEVRKIFAMAQAMLGIDSLDDGAAILRSSAIGLLPRLGGALYLMNLARDRLNLTVAWCPDPVDGAHGPAAPVPPVLLPGECWALKRGRPHLNAGTPDTLRCGHAPLQGGALELPLIARGTAIGLLVLSDPEPGAGARLDAAQTIAAVLADSLCLGLASVLLRDSLRDQALRDSLTGLYNRRFLQETLESLVHQARRRHTALAAIMIDLDHFKRLNDEHGHAVGDAALKLTAAVLLGGLRASDVACRYGGEEFLVLLSECTLPMARAKAEALRISIAALSRENGPQISASFGVSVYPVTAADGPDLLASADAALYRAKQAGRNRVNAAEDRSRQPGAALIPQWGTASSCADQASPEGVAAWNHTEPDRHPPDRHPPDRHP